MDSAQPLHLYEEILLLALRDRRGTVMTGHAGIVLAGAVLGDLLLEGRISVEDTRRQLVDLCDARSTRDAVLDECLDAIGAARRRANLRNWVSRLARVKHLRHKAARRLCDRGILRLDQEKILFLFSRNVYPEVDPEPERAILERLRSAMQSAAGSLEPRTVTLMALAHTTRLLAANLGGKDVRACRKRIEEIVRGNAVGEAVKAVIVAMEMAAMASMSAATAATVST